MLGAELAEAVQKLVTAESIMKVNKGILDADPRSAEDLEAVRNVHRTTHVSLDALFTHIFGSDDDERQGIVRNPEVTVMSRLYGVEGISVMTLMALELLRKIYSDLLGKQ